MLPTKTSNFEWPNVSFKFKEDVSSMHFDNLFISLAFKPADLLTPLASYITINEMATARANIGSSKPKSLPNPDVIEVIKAEWLEGIPPVSKIIPILNSPSEKKVNTIFKNWAAKQEIKLQKSNSLLINSKNSTILIHYLSISICDEVC